MTLAGTNDTESGRWMGGGVVLLVVTRQSGIWSRIGSNTLCFGGASDDEDDPQDIMDCHADIITNMITEKKRDFLNSNYNALQQASWYNNKCMWQVGTSSLAH